MKTFHSDDGGGGGGVSEEVLEKFSRILGRKDNIRNVSIIAHVDHGKSTLINSLVAAPGIITQEAAGTASCADEAKCGKTATSSALSIHYKMTDEVSKVHKKEIVGNEYLINLVESPGCTGFSSEVTAASCVTDGTLVVVDYSEGVCVQTETLLRQSLVALIRPVMTINKVDKCFVELQVDGEEAYKTFSRVIENANAIMAMHEDHHLFHDVQVYPDKGTVAFSSGVHGWAFTLDVFAKLYASKFGVDASKMMERLWGENFFDPATKKWTTMRTASATCKRGFVQFCYEPIRQIIAACMNDRKDKLWAMLQKLGVEIKSEEKDLTGKPLMKRVMQTWLPAASGLLEMMISHLPSPSTAQRYRVENLYEGRLDDHYAAAIRNCDPRGPLMLYVFKMICDPKKGRSLAFGRVFSGVVSTGSKVRIMGRKTEISVTIRRTLICLGKEHASVESVPCGNLVLMAGLDHVISQTATITNVMEVDAQPIRTIMFSLLPVVRVRVECKLTADIPKLKKGIEMMTKCFSVEVSRINEGEGYIVAGAGELYLQMCLKYLEGMCGTEILRSEPLTVFLETVLVKGERMPVNKDNRLYLETRPLEVGSEEFVLKRNSVEEIWCWDGSNLLVNSLKGVQYLREVKDSVTMGFQLATRKGILAGENMRGICVEVREGVLHAGASHKAANLVSSSINAICASQRKAKPRLLEPIYLVEILTPTKWLGTVFSLISKRQNCKIIKESYKSRELCQIQLHLPVRSSFGFFKKLQTATAGRVLFSYMFDHWKVIEWIKWIFSGISCGGY